LATRIHTQFNTPHIGAASVERTTLRRNGQMRTFSVGVGVGLNLRQTGCRTGRLGRIMLAL
jgi:hypothetical protein